MGFLKKTGRIIKIKSFIQGRKKYQRWEALSPCSVPRQGSDHCRARQEKQVYLFKRAQAQPSNQRQPRQKIQLFSLFKFKAQRQRMKPYIQISSPGAAFYTDKAILDKTPQPTPLGAMCSSVTGFVTTAELFCLRNHLLNAELISKGSGRDVQNITTLPKALSCPPSSFLS